MYRISEELAKLLLAKMKPPVIESSGMNAFLPRDFNCIGILDPVCCFGSDFFYILESPVPVLYPELPFTPVLNGYFLYRKEELAKPTESFPITEGLVNPLTTDYERQVDVGDCAVIIPSDTEKLTAKTISTIERLIELEPLILDCLRLDK
jgi:hypothetical protein